jgi:type IV secretory pathway TrbF-like protein
MIHEDEFLRTVVRWAYRIGACAVLVIVALAGALVYLATRPKVPPYVVALDHGHIVGYASVFEGTQDLAPEVIDDQLRRFIYYVRAIPNNPALEQRNVHAAYAVARGQASRVVDDYYTRNPDKDPVKLAAKGVWRDIKIVRVMREPAPDTWRVEWVETDHPQLGDVTTAGWEAVMRIAVRPPDLSNQYNPLGIYVLTLDFQAAS